MMCFSESKKKKLGIRKLFPQLGRKLRFRLTERRGLARSRSARCTASAVEPDRISLRNPTLDFSLIILQIDEAKGLGLHVYSLPTDGH
jgi:hypothetical protein